MASVTVKVNPQILIWARTERGFSVEEVASKLNFATDLLKRWERDGESIPFDALEDLAKTYKRQAAIFFLPEVPPKTRKPKDNRNLAVDRGSYSPETLLAIRRANHYLKVARDIFDSSYWRQEYRWIDSLKGKKEDVSEEARSLRAILEAPVQSQINQKDAETAFRFWRKKVEDKLGIFVFQFPMPEEELDGFSYAFDELPYAIVINNQKAAVRKIFTLFHEVGHLLKHDTGLCVISDESNKNTKAVEFECNNFAGKFLVPAENLKVTTSVEEIFELANAFKVSAETYLRRMFEEKKILSSVFFRLLVEVQEKSNSFPRKTKENKPISSVIQSKSTRGSKFFNLVVGAVLSNRISFSSASDLLGVKVGNIR